MAASAQRNQKRGDPNRIKNKRISHHTGLGGNKRPTAWTNSPDKILTTLDHTGKTKGEPKLD